MWDHSIARATPELLSPTGAGAQTTPSCPQQPVVCVRHTRSVAQRLCWAAEYKLEALLISQKLMENDFFFQILLARRSIGGSPLALSTHIMAIVVAAAAAALSLSAPLTPCRAVARANAPVMQFGGASMTDVMQKAKMAQMRMHDLELGGEGNSLDWAQPKPVGQSLSESNMQWRAGSPVRYSQYADTQPFHNRRQIIGLYVTTTMILQACDGPSG